VGFSPRADEPREAVSVEAVSQRRPRNTGFGEKLFCVCVVLRRAKWIVESSALMTGVQDSVRPGSGGRRNRRSVQTNRICARIAR
jgi:hypothetical protein